MKTNIKINGACVSIEEHNFTILTNIAPFTVKREKGKRVTITLKPYDIIICKNEILEITEYITIGRNKKVFVSLLAECKDKQFKFKGENIDEKSFNLRLSSAINLINSCGVEAIVSSNVSYIWKDDICDTGMIHVHRTLELIKAFHNDIEGKGSSTIYLQSVYHILEAFLHPRLQRIFVEWVDTLAKKELKTVTLYTISPLMLQMIYSNKVNVTDYNTDKWCSDEALQKYKRRNPQFNFKVEEPLNCGYVTQKTGLK